MGLTERQERAFAFLMGRKGKWTTAKEIFGAVPGYTWDGKGDFCGQAGKEIYRDFRACSLDPSCPGIVVSDKSKGYRVASREEFLSYRARRLRSLKKSLADLYAMDRKAMAHGQGTVGADGIVSFLETLLGKEAS